LRKENKKRQLQRVAVGRAPEVFGAGNDRGPEGEDRCSRMIAASRSINMIRREAKYIDRQFTLSYFPSILEIHLII
jgi:hypothetical protein